ncbi:MAG: hypothetical protein OXF25_10045 [Cyanobacteria bacterium MAG CAR3_bin_5]|nr:hypothetical protein [Cyanobacteria bacterium MAG CAR3_bin_5]
MVSQTGLSLLHTLESEWDLEPILVKAIDGEEGYGWTLDFACRVAEEYRRFLVLCLERRRDAHHLIVPSKSVDKFWHLHILDTEKYIEDCQHCFGSILYRSPYLREAEGLRMEYMNTFALYRFVFENSPTARDIWPLPSQAADLPSVYLDIDHDLEDASPSQETLSHTVRNKAEARQWIRENLDLELILVKAMDAGEGHGWTLDFARRVAEEYRRFLVLCLEHQDAHHLIVPSKSVDKFWHLHILDTRKYMEDCQYCFGFSLHHFPYFGMRGDGDAISLRETYYETLVLYQSAFDMAAPADIWPHSKTALIWWSTVRQTLSRRGEEGGSRFDRRRPRLADLEPLKKTSHGFAAAEMRLPKWKWKRLHLLPIPLIFAFAAVLTPVISSALSSTSNTVASPIILSSDDLSPFIVIVPIIIFIVCSLPGMLGPDFDSHYFLFRFFLAIYARIESIQDDHLKHYGNRLTVAEIQRNQAIHDIIDDYIKDFYRNKFKKLLSGGSCKETFISSYFVQFSPASSIFRHLCQD